MFDLIQEFSTGLIKEAGFGNLQPDEKRMYEQKIAQLATEKIGTELLKNLNDNDREEYFELIENNPTQIEIYNFMSRRVPNLNQFVIDILKNFRKDFLENLSRQSD